MNKRRTRTRKPRKTDLPVPVMPYQMHPYFHPYFMYLLSKSTLPTQPTQPAQPVQPVQPVQEEGLLLATCMTSQDCQDLIKNSETNEKTREIESIVGKLKLKLMKFQTASPNDIILGNEITGDTIPSDNLDKIDIFEEWFIDAMLEYDINFDAIVELNCSSMWRAATAESTEDHIKNMAYLLQRVAQVLKHEGKLVLNIKNPLDTNVQEMVREKLQSYLNNGLQLTILDQKYFVLTSN